jgi:two-component system nitrogen regulation response regulator GlnG
VRDPESTISTPTEAENRARPCLAARILCHPNLARVGDFTPLFDERGTGTIAIHRHAPEFRSADARTVLPLQSQRVTRSPLHVTKFERGVVLRFDEASPPVVVNGTPLIGERSISNEALARGVVVLFGRYLVLWIGWLQLVEPAPLVQGLVGESSVMRHLRQQIHRVAPMEVPVLVRGETGVGKELVARALHGVGLRDKQEYVAVNVASIPPSTAASELFGHKRGAFTGATEDRKGYFLQAHKGTLFLDEIGEVSFDVQALLLRAVQNGVIQPVGGVLRQVDVRLIAATDADLEAAVARREFREPLLRRFSYEIHVPPVRARRDDIGLLFYHLLRERLEATGEGHLLVASGAEEEPWVPGSYVADMAQYDWPGNVRELSSVALSFIVENKQRARGRITDELRRLITPREPPREDAVPPESAKGNTDALSDEALKRALRDSGYSAEKAARRLGVSKSYFYKRIEKSKLLRGARALELDEIHAAVSTCGGDIAQAAARLEVSERALRLRLRGAT